MHEFSRRALFGASFATAVGTLALPAAHAKSLSGGRLTVVPSDTVTYSSRYALSVDGAGKYVLPTKFSATNSLTPLPGALTAGTPTSAPDQLVTARFTAAIPRSGATYSRAIARRSSNGASHYAAVLTLASTGEATLTLERQSRGHAVALAEKSVGRISGGAGTTVKFELAIRVRDRIIEAQYLRDNAQPVRLFFADTQATSAEFPTSTGTAASGYVSKSSPSTTPLTLDWVRGEPWGEFRGSTYAAGWGPLVFSDDFDDPRYQGTDNLDPAKWRNVHFDHSDHDWGVTQRNNVRVKNSALEVWARRLNNPITVSSASRPKRPWSTSRVDTIGKWSAPYFRSEARMRMPNSRAEHTALWSAYWFRPNDGTRTGEIDVAEAFGATKRPDFDNANRVLSSIHFTNDANNQQKVAGWTPVIGQTNADEYHTWTVEKTPQGITCYFDGMQTVHVPASDPRFARTYPSNSPFHLRFNMQVGNSYWGNYTNSTRDGAIYVDYVRVWQYRG